MSLRRVNAVFSGAVPLVDGGACAIELAFRPTGPRPPALLIEDIASLGPDESVEAVRGLGKVLRLLRAARRAPPDDPRQLLGRPLEASHLLAAALGTPVVLAVRPRTRQCFVAWTEGGVRQVEDVADVVEDEDLYLVLRQGGRAPVRVARRDVVRTERQRHTWYEVLGIERR